MSLHFPEQQAEGAASPALTSGSGRAAAAAAEAGHQPRIPDKGVMEEEEEQEEE